MIQLKGVTKDFGTHRAVHDLDLTVTRGELFGLIGANGAGKTTTLRMVSGVILPTSGEIAIAGFSLAKDPLAAKRIMGFIPDRPYLYEKLTGWEFLRFISQIYQVGPTGMQRKAEELMDIFGLAGRRHDLIATYSHGMRQRLIIAATLLHDPLVIIVDEPMVGLDPAGIKLVRDCLKEQSHGGKTILLSTHMLSLAENLCDRIGIIDNGRLQMTGTLEELRQKAEAGEGDLEAIFLRLTEGGGER